MFGNAYFTLLSVHGKSNALTSIGNKLKKCNILLSFSPLKLKICT